MNILEMKEEYLNCIANNLSEYDEFWNEKILQDEFKNENSEYFVLIEEGEIIGFGGLWFNFDEAHVMNIAIKRDKRKKGFGTILLKFLIKIAKERNKGCITLEVREGNLAAINLYRKMDFNEMGRRKRYYNGQFDAIIMTKIF